MNQIQLQRHDPQAAIEAGHRSRSFKPFGEDGLTFGDVIDLINPLQHIPLLSSVYRKLTGDGIDPAIRIAGGALFGGPIGVAFAAVAVAVGEFRGHLRETSLDPTVQVADLGPKQVNPTVVASDPPQEPTVQVAHLAQIQINTVSFAPDPLPESTAESAPWDQVQAIPVAVPVRPGGWIVAAASHGLHEHRSEVSPAIRLASLQLGEDPVREIRRGGWMIVQSYGPDLAALSDEDRDRRTGKVDIAV